MKIHVQLLLVIAICCLIPEFVHAQDNKQDETETKAAKMQRFTVADGVLTFDAPSDWKKVQPKINFIHAEFDMPRAPGDERDGRITFSQVGGGIEGNLSRWVGQFKDVDESDEEQVIRKSKKIDGMEVQLIKIHGTYLDTGGRPFGPKSEMDDYILFGAAIEAESGDVYIKAYGPAKTMKQHHKALEAMLTGMKSSDG